MKSLYSLLIALYGFGIRIAGLFHAKAKYFVEGRKGLIDQLRVDFKDHPKDVIWIHCASVGEFEQGRPLIEAIKTQHPSHKILLTFYSPSGYNLRKNYELADWVRYLPIDSPKNAKLFVEITHPQICIFIKYEVWPNFFYSIKNKGIPLIMVSAIFRENHRYFRNKWMGQVLKSVNHFFVQDDPSKKLLENIGISQITVSGDTRFDRVFDISSKVKDLPIIHSFKGDSLLLVMGSSWETDEKLILSYLKRTRLPFKIIIAPHEIGGMRISELRNKFDGRSCLYSQAENLENMDDYQVMIIDNIGMLSRIYRYSDISFIGGGFGAGIHNILEAATFGQPIIFGPHYRKFLEARELIGRSGAFSISNQGKFNEILDLMIEDRELRLKTGDICRKYVNDRTGATQIVMDYLRPIID